MKKLEFKGFKFLAYFLLIGFLLLFVYATFAKEYINFDSFTHRKINDNNVSYMKQLEQNQMLNNIWIKYGDPVVVDMTNKYKKQYSSVVYAGTWTLVIKFNNTEFNMVASDYQKMKQVEFNILQLAQSELVSRGLISKYDTLRTNKIQKFLDYEDGTPSGSIEVQKYDDFVATIKIILTYIKTNSSLNKYQIHTIKKEVKTITRLDNNTSIKNSKYPRYFEELEEFDSIVMEDYTDKVIDLYPNKNIKKATQYSMEINYNKNWKQFSRKERQDYYNKKNKLMNIFSNSAKKTGVFFDFRVYEEGLHGGVWTLSKDGVDTMNAILYIAEDTPKKNPALRFRILEIQLGD